MVPVIKNGPKGISDFKDFLFKIINPIPIIAPKRKAENKANKILGNPRKNPIKKANFISPIPIQLPRETKTITRKNSAAPKALYTMFSISYLVYMLKKMPAAKYPAPDTKITGKITLSGIM